MSPALSAESIEIVTQSRVDAEREGAFKSSVYSGFTRRGVERVRVSYLKRALNYNSDSETYSVAVRLDNSGTWLTTNISAAEYSDMIANLETLNEHHFINLTFFNSCRVTIHRDSYGMLTEWSNSCARE